LKYTLFVFFTIFVLTPSANAVNANVQQTVETSTANVNSVNTNQPIQNVGNGSVGLQNSFFGQQNTQCGFSAYVKAGNNSGFVQNGSELVVEAGATYSSNPCNSQEEETERAVLREAGETTRSCITQRGANAAILIEKGMDAASIKSVLDSICTLSSE